MARQHVEIVISSASGITGWVPGNGSPPCAIQIASLRMILSPLRHPQGVVLTIFYSSVF